MKKKLLVLFGGQSAEHDISIISASNVVKAADRSKFDLHLVMISRSGVWNYCKTSVLDNCPSNPKKLKPIEVGPIVYVSPGVSKLYFDDDKELDFDVVFPVLHGPMGEDGNVQGLIRILNAPVVGSGVLGSAIGMDKDVMKKLLVNENIPVVPWLTFHSIEEVNLENVFETLGSCVFVKPANMGSSLGVSKAQSKSELQNAIQLAFQYDVKVIIESGYKVREIEIGGIKENGEIKVSIPGEIIPHGDFYTYEKKYVDENGASLIIPAKVNEKQFIDIQNIAKKTFKTLNTDGFARIDMFIDEKEQVFVNEINTLPGFTSISMFPMMWKASGLEYPHLIEVLVYEAINRFETLSKLKTTA